MKIDNTLSVDIIETKENYISRVKPGIDIRSTLKLHYEIINQSVILNEIRPAWNKPHEIRKSGHAKATFVESKNSLRVFWKRAINKWHNYKPAPEVKELKASLNLVESYDYVYLKG